MSILNVHFKSVSRLIHCAFNKHGSVSYLFPLNHLLVKVVWEGSQGAKLSRALGTCEDAIFIDQTATADGDQGYTMATETFIQVYVSSLDLVINRNGPADRDEKKKMTQLNRTKTQSASERRDKSYSQTSRSMNGWIEFHTWIPRGPRLPHQHLLRG